MKLSFAGWFDMLKYELVMPMKVAVIGSRSLDDACYPLIREHLPGGCSEIISGGARGVDMLAERFAKEENLLLTVIRPDYAAYDKAAPLIRNAEIVSKADFVLVLWDGRSRGSLNVIMTCMQTNKPYKLVLVSRA